MATKTYEIDCIYSPNDGGYYCDIIADSSGVIMDSTAVFATRREAIAEAIRLCVESEREVSNITGETEGR